jgi:DinB superfamily
MLIRPPETEIPSFFAGYVNAVPADAGVIEILAGQLASFPALLRQFPEPRTEIAYAPGKWSLKQAIEHVNDAERIFSYRMLRIARGDQTPLPGFEQDDYVANSWANARPWSGLIEDFEAVRRATLSLARSLPDDAWVRTGTASGAHSSARMFAYVIAGHVAHHAGVVESKYVPLLK